MDGNSTHLNLHFSKEGINRFINDYMMQYSQHKITTDSYDITLKKSWNTDLNIHTSESSSSVIVEIPMDFTFYKKAGLFSVEGLGSVSICVEIAYDILPDLSYTTKSSLLDYKWTQKPIVHLGTFNLPIEILSDCIIHFMKDGVLSKLDQVIKEHIDLRSLIKKQWKQYATNYQLYLNPSIYFNAELHQITSQHLKAKKTHLKLYMYFDMDIKISDNPIEVSQDFNPKFLWEDAILEDYHQEAQVEFSYHSLAKIILSKISGKEFGGKKVILESVHIHKGDNIEIKANMTSPLEGIITISCLPVLDNVSQMIDLKNLDVNVDANNVIFRLASPVIESAITKKLKESLPLDLTLFMDTYIKKIPEIQLLGNRISLIPSLNRTKIESIQFDQHNINVLLSIENMEIGVIA